MAGHPPRGRPPTTPRQAAPTGHASPGDSAGPPHPHTPAHSTWLVDPDSPPRGRAVGGGKAHDLRRPSERRKAPPQGRPPAIPTARNDGSQGRTLWGRCWVPTRTPTAPGTHGSRNPGCRPRRRAAGRGTAPYTRCPSQRWQAIPPEDGPPPPPRHAAPTGHASQGDSAGPPHPHIRARSMWVADPDSPPRGRAAGGGGAPELRRPSQRRKAPPPGTSFGHANSAQRRLARAHAVGPVLDPHAHTNRTRDTRVAEPRLPAPEDGRPEEGQRLTPDAPHNGGRPPPPGMAPHHPRCTQPPTGHASHGASAGPPHPHTRAHSTWVADPDSPPGWRAVGGGGAPDPRSPSQWRKAPPPGTPFCQPHSAQRRLARAHAVGPVLGPHAHTNRTRDTRVAEPWLPAPEKGRPEEGQRLSPDAPHNLAGHPPRGRAPTTPRQAAPTGHASPGDSAGPPHTHNPAHSTWLVDPDSPPRGRAVGGGEAHDLRRPSERRKAPPRGRPPAIPTARNDGSQGRTLWGRCWVPTPTPTAPGTHGSPNPGCRPRRRAAGRGTAPDTRCPSQLWQALPPEDGLPPPPRHAAPTGHASQGDSAGPPHPHIRAHSMWVADPDSPPGGRAAGRGGAPELGRPSQQRKAPPLETPFCHPRSAQRRLARAHAVGLVLGPHTYTNRTRETRVAEPRLPAPEDRRPEEGQRLTPHAPHNGRRPPPPGTAARHPRGTQPPHSMQAKGKVLGPHTPTPAPTAPG